MDSERLLCAALLTKILEQIEPTDHLIRLLPADQPDWKPAIPVRGRLKCSSAICSIVWPGSAQFWLPWNPSGWHTFPSFEIYP